MKIQSNCSFDVHMHVLFRLQMASPPCLEMHVIKIGLILILSGLNLVIGFP